MEHWTLPPELSFAWYFVRPGLLADQRASSLPALLIFNLFQCQFYLKFAWLSITIDRRNWFCHHSLEIWGRPVAQLARALGYVGSERYRFKSRSGRPISCVITRNFRRALFSSIPFTRNPSSIQSGRGVKFFLNFPKQITSPLLTVTNYHCR